MYIAICDDQVDELESLTSLLLKWQSERQTTCRFKTFRNAAELLDAAESGLKLETASVPELVSTDSPTLSLRSFHKQSLGKR